MEDRLIKHAIGCLERAKRQHDLSDGEISMVIELLKEQEDLGTELTNAVELIHKKNERIEKLLKQQEAQKFLVDKSGKITPLPVVVRCKDCKHGVLCNEGEIDCTKDIGTFKATIHEPDWFCADGERADT